MTFRVTREPGGKGRGWGRRLRLGYGKETAALHNPLWPEGRQARESAAETTCEAGACTLLRPRHRCRDAVMRPPVIECDLTVDVEQPALCQRIRLLNCSHVESVNLRIAQRSHGYSVLIKEKGLAAKTLVFQNEIASAGFGASFLSSVAPCLPVQAPSPAASALLKLHSGCLPRTQI